MTRRQLEAAAEEAGWQVEIKPRYSSPKEDKCIGWYVCFTTDTRLGQDVFYEYEVKSLEEVKQEVDNTYEGYDPDHEATLWYGQQGCPHSLTDLIEDMQQVDGKLEDLCLALHGNKVKKPEGVDFTRKANNLRVEALSALTEYSHRAKPHPDYYSSKGFENPDKSSKYEWVIFLNYRWLLLDGDGLQYDVECMPLEEFCEMVDAIINGKE